MRLGAKGMDADKLNVMSSEIAPVLTSGPPGITDLRGKIARIGGCQLLARAY